MRTFDYTTLASASWDSEMLGLIARIHEHKGRQEFYLKQTPDTIHRLVEIAKIQSTESSNKIEGIVTTDTRVRQLCLEKTTPRNRDEEEILGYRYVLNTIHEGYEYIPLRTSYILQLHRDLYEFSEKDIGGRFKNTDDYITETRIDGTRYFRFKPLSPYETPDAVDAICDSYNKTLDAGYIDPLILIPTFINDFLCIHPFNDGNGRMSRLLTTLLLSRCGIVVGRYISLERKIEQTREVYYDVLKKSSVNWHEGTNDPVPFIKYFLGILLSAYRDFESRVSLFDENPLALTLVRKATAKKLGKFTKRDIMEMTPSLAQSTVENALKQLVREGSISRHGNGRATYYTRNDKIKHPHSTSI